MQKDNRRLCSVCGKPLQIRTCFACSGRGDIGHFFWKQTCGRCKGSGLEYECPDDFKHQRERIERESRKYLDRFRAYTCPQCGGTGWLYDPVTKLKVPCPTCRKGQSEYLRPPQPPPLGHPWWEWTGRR
jgi:DnaJ-class molecular chaperone